MESAPFHWQAGDAGHLAATLHRAGATGMRHAAAFSVAAGIVALSLLVTSTSTGTVLALVAILVGAMVPAAMYWGMPWWIARWLRFHADCTVTATWDETGYSTSGCQHNAASQITWKEVSQVIETSRYLILRTGCGPFFLPKQALDAEAMDDLRGRLDQHGVNRVLDPSAA